MGTAKGEISSRQTSTVLAMVDNASSNAARRHELGRFLRARRAALQPEQFGFRPRPRRRVPGLLRYEVAELAGVSDTWYTWLEQARDVRVSASALDAVSRALQLDIHAHEHVRRLAGLAVDPAPICAEPLDALSDLIDDQMPNPACLITASLDLHRWNHMYGVIFGDPGQVPPEQRNALRSLLMNPNVRELVEDWTGEVSAGVAHLAFENGKYPGNPSFAALIEELSSTSQKFRELWKGAMVRPYANPDLVVHHRELGTLQFSKIHLRPVDEPSLLVCVFRPATEATREVIHKLRERARDGGPQNYQDANAAAAEPAH